MIILNWNSGIIDNMELWIILECIDNIIELQICRNIWKYIDKYMEIYK